MNVIPNKECILIIHKFELNCIFRIKSDSSSAEFARYGVIWQDPWHLANSAEDESDLIRNIQFNSNLRIINMHSLFGITFILYLLKLSAGKGFCRAIFSVCYNISPPNFAILLILRSSLYNCNKTFRSSCLDPRIVYNANSLTNFNYNIVIHHNELFCDLIG